MSPNCLREVLAVARSRPWWLWCAAIVLPAMVQAADVPVVLTIATVNNGHMLTLQRLSKKYEARHPGVRLKWVTMEEGPLRQQLSRDINQRTGQYDVMTIGALEAPIWGRQGMLRALKPPAAFDLPDLLPGIRQALSAQGQLYALPFYGESSMTMVRSDLLKRAGLSLPAHPTWEQIRQAAAALHDPAHDTYGICLRGRPGWGENLTLLTPMVKDRKSTRLNSSH